MLEKTCNPAECGIVAALFEVCIKRRVSMYQHVNGSDIVKLMDEYLGEQGLTLSFCLEAIKKTPFAQSPRLEPEEAKEDLNLPKIWLPKFLAALEQTLKNPNMQNTDPEIKNRCMSKIRFVFLSMFPWGHRHDGMA